MDKQDITQVETKGEKKRRMIRKKFKDHGLVIGHVP